MDASHKIRWSKLLTLIFLIIVIVDLFAEYLAAKNIIYIVKPLITVLVIILYLINSRQRDTIFIITLLLGLLSSALFIPDDSITLLWGVGVFAVHRLFLIIFLIKLLKPIDYIPVAIACLPVLLIFFYLLSINVNLDTRSIILFSINNILIALFCGIVFANYMMKKDDNNTWLLISALMFIALQMIVYIEKFYLIEFSPRILRPIAVLFLSIALFTLLRGVLTQERLNGDASS